MKILLLGDYSGVHSTLAEGLRKLGHSVTVASNGDFWKDYPRDIDLKRGETLLEKLSFLARLLFALPKMRGYDVVQLINPIFLEVKTKRCKSIYKLLRKWNKRMVLCCMGNDYYYPIINKTLKPMRYSDYNIGTEERCVQFAQVQFDDWVGTEKGELNRFIAADCDAIVSGAYEFWLPIYLTEDCDRNGKPLREKLTNIPFPFKIQENTVSIADDSTDKSKENTASSSNKLRVFIGISKARSQFKGTDIMLKVAQDLQEKYPDRIELKIANGVPFAQYQHMMDTSDVLMDQIYAYGPAMNALLAMSKGIICMTGGEPEHYDLMGEKDCRPIINVEPSYDSVYEKLEQLVLHPEMIPQLKEQSRTYVERNYDYIKVAKQYESLYKSLS